MNIKITFSKLYFKEGSIKLNLTRVSEDDLKEVYKTGDIEAGGKWKPKYCKQKRNNFVAIIIPYRNRKEHLNLFLLNMLPIFMRQKAYIWHLFN